jgi:predicted Zn-dependent peptidase
MESAYKLTTLPNGVRIASYPMPHMKSASVGFWVGVGGRHESREQAGIAHFIEHLLFKGTRRRTALQISEAVEGVGGYLNAFTTEDHTCYYAKAGAAHLPVLCDVLCDMYLSSTLAAEDIERERDVIREEILMYRDQPAQHVHELLTETMWPDHPLGRSLTGTVETILGLKRTHFREFIARNYNSKTTVVTVAGNISHSNVVALLEPSLRKLRTGRTPRFAKAREVSGPARVSVYKQDTEQTHLAMGFHAFGRKDERRFALKLLSVILGENMSSRLFQRLREQHGYCYNISSNMVALEETGAIQISAGLDHGNLKKAIGMILKELRALCARKPGVEELRKARDYTLGQTLMGLESTTNQMMWMGEGLLGYRKILGPEDVERQICSVTAEQIQSVAADCLSSSRLGVAIVGPQEEADAVRSWVR